MGARRPFPPERGKDLMSILVFVLSLVLLAAGLMSGYMSLDLVPTGPGLVYALAGAVGVVGAIVVFALGVLAVRVGGLTRALSEHIAAVGHLAAASEAHAEQAIEPPLAAADEAELMEAHALEAIDAHALAAEGAPEGEPEPEEAEAPTAEEPRGDREEADPERAGEPLSGNSAGSPTLGEIERAIGTLAAPPTLVGRYTSGGANYMIFSDGSIEAETDEGAFKFASMGDFKQFLTDGNKGKA